MDGLGKIIWPNSAESSWRSSMVSILPNSHFQFIFKLPFCWFYKVSRHRATAVRFVEICCNESIRVFNGYILINREGNWKLRMNPHSCIESQQHHKRVVSCLRGIPSFHFIFMMERCQLQILCIKQSVQKNNRNNGTRSALFRCGMGDDGEELGLLLTFKVPQKNQIMHKKEFSTGSF